MAKPQTIRAMLAAAPPAKTFGPTSWAEKLRLVQPALMKEVDETIDALLRGEDWVLCKTPTKTALADFLKPIVRAGRSSVVRYIDERANGAKK